MEVSERPLSHPKYRADIDGLRGVAVLSVVAFHAFPNYAKGGFIGVDIFFVISGFLISTIIFQNLERGTFSFSEFYARRIKRIFPALLTVLIACAGFGWFALFANEYAQLGKHIAAGSAFISNYVLWGEAGYFDELADTKPLLHLWSLGIEEQFYLVWPLVLWLAWKIRFNALSITIAVALVSFALNVGEIHRDTVAAFYSPQTRFWELLAGSLLAWLTLHDGLVANPGKVPASGGNPAAASAQVSAWPANAISAAGLVLLAYGFARINKNFYFPGFWALLPVSGAVLLIHAGPAAWFNRKILASRFLVWFGLISFPLYLWHWPLLSFARIMESHDPSKLVRVSAVVLAVALAYATFLAIERPLRWSRHTRVAVSALAAVSVLVAVCGFGIYRLDGIPTRSSLIGATYPSARLGPDDAAAHSACLRMYAIFDDIRFCRASGDKPAIAIIGDSHGAALYEGLAPELKLENKSLLLIGGRLFLDVATSPPGDAAEIAAYKGGIKATQFVAAEKSIDTVIMVSRGPFYLRDDWVFKLISRPDVADRKKVWRIAMKETLDSMRLAGKKVIFVLDNPELDFDPLSCSKRPMTLTTTFDENCAVSRQAFDADSADYRHVVFDVLKDYPEVKVFDMAAYLCDDKACHAARDGHVLYGDRDHLSRDGAVYMARELTKVIDGGIPKTLEPPGPQAANP